MAKATSKEKGASARPRITRAAPSADAATVQTPLAEESRGDEAELALANDDEEQRVEDEAYDGDDDASLRLDPLSLSGVGGSGGAVTIAPPKPTRTYVPPDPLLHIPGVRFLYESVLELQKVTWPTRSEAWNMTLIVIAMSAVIAAILGAADIGLTHLLTWILSA